MMRSLWTAASGMRAQQVNVDTIANNVANINTIGYKSQQASFKCRAPLFLCAHKYISTKHSYVVV